MKKRILFLTILTGILVSLQTAVLAQPTWQVNPYDYTYSMTVTAKLNPDAHFSTDSNDKLAAFINGECRGVANVKYIAATNDYFVFLMLYSNDPTGTVSFKMYDASQNLELTASQTISFSVNGIVGSITNPFLIAANSLNNQAELLDFSIPNQEGATTIDGDSVLLAKEWSPNLDAVVASFTLSNGARAYIESVEQFSGVNVVNYNSIVTFLVVSADMSQQKTYYIHITIANDIPTDIVLNDTLIEENDVAMLVGELTTITANPNEQHVYTILEEAGTDYYSFEIDGNKLKAKQVFDFELDSVYTVKIMADDQKGGTVQKLFNIHIVDLNESPYNFYLLNFDPPVQVEINDRIAILNAADQDRNDSHIFTFADGDGDNDRDNDLFYISNTELLANAQLLFRMEDEYFITIKCTDSKGAFLIKHFKIKTLYAPNDESKIITFRVPNQVDSTVFDGTNVTLSTKWTSDLKNIVPTFTLSSGANTYVNEQIQTSGTTANDFTNPVIYKVEAADLSFLNYTVTITHAPDTPTEMSLSNNSLNENAGKSFIGILDAVAENPDRNYTYTLVNKTGVDNQYFFTSNDSLFSYYSLDYELKNTFKVNVKANDGNGGVMEKIFTINLLDVNEAPTGIDLSNLNTPVDAPTGTNIAILKAVDPDKNDDHVFSLVNGNGIDNKDNGLFYIDGDTLKAKQQLEFQTNNSYKIYIKVTDSGGNSRNYAKVIKSMYRGEPPTNIVLSNQSVVVGDDTHILVGTLHAIDADQASSHKFTLSYDISNGPDNSYFTIVSNALYLENPLPSSEKSFYKIRVIASDSLSNQVAKTFIINAMMPLDEVVFTLTNSNLGENMPSGTIVGYFTSSQSIYNDITLSLPLEIDLNQYDNDKFYINGRTLLANTAFDFEQSENALLKIEFSDGTTTVSQDVMITITDKNDAPSSISLSSKSVSESAALDTEIGTLSVVDQDFSDSHVFTLIDGNGINDAGNAYFKISGNKIMLAKAIDYETKQWHSILVRATDKSGGYFDQEFRIDVTNTNDAPVFVSVPDVYVLEGNVYVYELEVKDSENDAIQIEIVNLPGWLNFNSELNLIVGTPDNSAVGTYYFSIKASDLQTSAIQTIALSVINVNDAPEVKFYIDPQLFYSEVENSVVLPDDCFIDQDKDDKLNYTLSSGTNSALPSWLNFDASTMTLSGSPSATNKGTYQLKLTAKDKGNLSAWMNFELNVISSTTGVFSLNSENEISIYPNPVHGMLNIKLPKLDIASTVTLTNIEGKFNVGTWNLPSGSTAIDLAKVPQGLYLISIKQGEVNYRSKVLVQ